MKIEYVQIPSPSCTLAYAKWAPVGPAKGTVVAVHGVSRQKRDFDYLAAYLSEHGFLVLAVDAPGRGGSSWFENPDDYTNPAVAEVFYAFLQALDLPPVHWIGASMGGLIALEMAKKGYEKSFRTVTLVDITHRPNFAACTRIADYLPINPPVLQSVDQQITATKNNLPLGDVPYDVWKHFAIHQLVQKSDGFHFHFDPKTMICAQKGLREVIDVTEGLMNLTCPIALVAGEISDMCTQQEIADLIALRAGTKIHICPKAGHTPSLSDTPSQTFIYEFLR